MTNILLSRGIIADPKIYIYLKNYISAKMKVLIIPWAYNKGEASKYKAGSDYINKLILDFMPYQIMPEQIEVLDYEKDSYEQMVDKIKKQDIIYLPGGEPELFYDRIREKGISEFIKKNANIVIGSSAGALIQFKQYHLTPVKGSKEIAFNQGLGLLDNFRIEVHYENTKAKNKNLDKVMEMAPIDIYCLYDDSMIIIENGSKIYNLYKAFKYIPTLKKK